MLFKADDRGTGEDWAEVITCELCRLIGLPHVDYELAVECDGPVDLRPGVVCENIAPKSATLVLGNQLLLALDPNYPHHQRFRVQQHTIEAVSKIVRVLAAPSAVWMASVPKEIESALDVFAGYIMLDAWIANQDRHHENWGALIEEDKMRLAPTFDHGAALARNLLDIERESRMTTKDRNRTVGAFAQRGRSAFYRTSAEKRPLELTQTFREFAAEVPQAKRVWLDRLQVVNREMMRAVIERVPAVRMSDTTKQFTLELLETNQRRLLNRGN